MPKVKKGKIITVTSMKGGIGKTTTVLLLASVFANMKKSVLIVDLDLYAGSIAFSVNADIKNNIFNLCDDITNNRCKFNDLDKYLYKYDENISILAAPKDPRQANKIEKKCIEVLLSNFTYNYDVILIDTNHILDVTNMLAFDYSDTILDIFTNDAFDLKETKTFVSICKNGNVNNMLLVLNNAIDDRKKYFSLYDIKNIIKKNVDYIIPVSLNIKNYDMYIMEGSVLKYYMNKPKGYSDIEKLALKLLEDKEGAMEDEEK